MHIESTSQVLCFITGIWKTYHTHISGKSQAYIRHILGTYHAYPKHISGVNTFISQAYIKQSWGKFQAYIWCISGIYQQNFKLISATHLSHSQANLSHNSAKNSNFKQILGKSSFSPMFINFFPFFHSIITTINITYVGLGTTITFHTPPPTTK